MSLCPVWGDTEFYVDHGIMRPGQKNGSTIELDLAAELDEMAHQRAEAFKAKQEQKRAERADHLLRRKYGKATLHALKQARSDAQGGG